MNIIQLVENAESSEFYPTPATLAKKMIAEHNKKKF